MLALFGIPGHLHGTQPKGLPALIFHVPQLEADAEAKSALGHMREMYAFVAAAAVARFKLELQVTVEGCLQGETAVALFAGWLGRQASWWQQART